MSLPASERLKILLASAQKLASELGAAEVNTGHLLIAMNRDPNCFASQALENHGYDTYILDHALEGKKEKEVLVPVERILADLKAKKDFEP